jgi:agmatinase
MGKDDIVKKFNPNAPGISGNIFGLPHTPENAQLIIIPIPWEVTVSYLAGTAKGPDAILRASNQIDHGNKDIDEPWKLGISMLPIDPNIYKESARLRSLAVRHIKTLESGKKVAAENPILTKINEGCENLNIYVKSITQKLLEKGKMVAILGGDHSTPLGFLRALREHHSNFGILQIDAHADLRKAYEGFTYSHASIMYHAVRLKEVSKLVQVGVRDFGDDELNLMERLCGKVITYFDQDLKSNSYKGVTWDALCDTIVDNLPQHVYISFDIDGLDPALCPSTGTPVAGGLTYNEAVYLVQKVVSSGRTIIGFDLCEVAAGSEWDANVGARILYQLCNWMAVSTKKLTVNNSEKNIK